MKHKNITSFISIKKQFTSTLILLSVALSINGQTYAYDVTANYSGSNTTGGAYALSSKANFAVGNTSLHSNYKRGGKFYLNAGHGGFDDNDRPTPMPLIGEYFYESEGNLDRALHLEQWLIQNGGLVKMSRRTNTTEDDLDLSTIATYSNNYGGYFISLHSNGANASANYHVALYKGSNSTNTVGGSERMAYYNSWNNYNNGCLTNTTYGTARSMADYDLMGLHYGVLRTNTCPGYLVETWFHDYRPESLRFKSSLYNKFLAWQIAVGNFTAPGGTGALPGCIIGDVRDVTKGCGYTNYTTRGRDSKLALNDVTVTCTDSNGNVVGTVNTGTKCNGVYAFFVPAGTYTITVKKTGYQTQTHTLTVTNSKATQKLIDMEAGTDAGISVDAPNIGYGETPVGNTSAKTLKVTGASLTSNITVTNSDNTNFSVTPASLGASGGTVNITYKPQSKGSHSTTITLKSGSYTATCKVTGTAINPVPTFTEVWNYSETSNKKAAWMANWTNYRNMAFGNGKLYVVDVANCVIKIVNAQSGAHIKDMNMTGVSGGDGALALVDVAYVGGKIVGTNIATKNDDAATAKKENVLKVYVWDNDDAAPKCILNTTDLGGMDRVGDAIEIQGNLTTGKICYLGQQSRSITLGTTTSTKNCNSIITYAITNGTVSTTPVKADIDNFIASLSPRLIPSGNDFWAVSQIYKPTLLDAAGEVKLNLNADALQSTQGNDFVTFTYKGDNYAFATEYDPGTSGDTNSMLKNGRAAFLSTTGDMSDATRKAYYPSTGLSANTRNTSCSSSICVNVNGEQGIEMWVLVHNQGIAYYKHGTVPTYTGTTEPAITCDAETVTFDEITVGYTASKTINVTGTGLSDGIKVSCNDNSNFTITPDSLGTTGGTLTVTYNPQSAGSHSATITLTSESVTSTISVSGTSVLVPNILCDVDSVAFGRIGIGATVEKQIMVTAENLTENIKITSSDNTNFSISSTGIDVSGGILAVTYKPQSAGTHNATITLTSGTATKIIYVSGERYKDITGSYSKGLTKIWQNTTNLPAYLDTRYAAVSNGKLIVNDKTNKKIIEITETGYSDYYDPSAILTEYYGGCTLSTAVSCDDAGNILINNNWAGALSGSYFMIISADLSTTYKLDLRGISGYTTARTDQVGQVRGNMLSAEGAYFTILPTNGMQALVVKVANGALADAKLVTTGLTHNSSSIAQPAYETVAEMASNMATSFISRERNLPTNVYTWASPEATSMDIGYTFTSTSPDGYTTKSAAIEGFNWFRLGGKSYFIMPITTDGTSSTRGSYFGIFDQDGNIVSTWTEGQRVATESVQIYGSFIVEPADEKSVFIYHYLSGAVAEKLRFAISDVINGVPVTPAITCDAETVTFEQIYVGYTSSKNIIVTGSNLLENISVTCSDNTNFSVNQSSLGTTGGTLTVTYKPQTSGTHNATITLTSGSVSKTINVSGSAIIEPNISCDVESLTFDEITVESTTSKTINVTGTGLSDGIKVSCNDNSNFTITPDSLGTTGGTLTVTYKPQSSGSHSATITLSSGSTTTTFTVTGRGTIEPKITCNISTVAFGQKYVGESEIKSVTVSAEGLSSNIIVTCSDNNNFSVSPTSLGTSGGTLTVTYKPQSNGSHSATITLTSGNATATFTASGTGLLVPKITCDQTSVQFNDSYLGESETESVSVTTEGLTSSISVICSDNNNFSVSPASLGTSGGTLTVTYKPQSSGSHSATITLSSGSTTEIISVIGYCAGKITDNYSNGITKIWQNTSNVPGLIRRGSVRYATVSNGKFLANDMTTNKIIELTESGYTDYYNPSTVLNANYRQGLGMAIASDDAGNILVNTAVNKDPSGTNFTIISADLSKTYKLDLSKVSGYNSVFVYQLGHIRGNMLSSEGAYVTIPTYARNVASVLKIVNGSVVLCTQVSTETTILSTTVTQPAYETVAEIEALANKGKSFMLRDKNSPQSIFTWASVNDNTMTKGYTFTKQTPDGFSTSNANNEGFDWFKLGDRAYFILPINSNNQQNLLSSSFGIFDETGRLAAYWTTGQKTITEMIPEGGSIIAVPIDDEVVYIYHFVPGTIAEKLCFVERKGSIGIDEIGADVTTNAEYYNLQGVRIMNPERGVYIKREGSKVTKVIL